MTVSRYFLNFLPHKMAHLRSVKNITQGDASEHIDIKVSANFSPILCSLSIRMNSTNRSHPKTTSISHSNPPQLGALAQADQSPSMADSTGHCNTLNSHKVGR